MSFHFRRLTRPLAVTALILLVSACSQPTGLLNVASSPAEDRSFASLQADSGIALRINDVLLNDEYRDLFFEISTDVYEGRVMLTGTVKSAANKERATTLVRGISGVKSVINELQVTQNYGIGPASNDLWIETKLKAQLVTTENISSINYRWRSVNGTVYVIGAARSQAELTKLLEVVRTTDRVKKVVNHATIRR